ncbi:MAG: CopG family transcriptional regulator [Clostridioides difficile]
MKKIGRPVGEGGRKSNDVKVRLDDSTNEKLLEYCQENNLTKAEAIRKGIRLLLQGKKNK